MGTFQFEWWTVEVKEATGLLTWEIKAKSKEGAIKRIQKLAADHTKEVRTVRPDFQTEVFWETMKLDRKGYQRRY